MSATLTTLIAFDGPNGEEPTGGDLVADAAGDLFGTTDIGGASGGGTVFEIAKTAGGYASTPTTLVNFNGADGTDPERSVIADSNGDLFGTTYTGGEFGYGTVFEVTKTATGYASTPTILVSFNGTDGGGPFSSLVADADGDLFGTTSGIGVDDDGTVFEIVKTPTGYASTPTTLASFNGANGAEPEAGLIADADRDLFGTTLEGGTNDDGTVFEIVKTPTGYASTPTTLASFNGANGTLPTGLIADSDGDLFGTTVSGGAYDHGTVFEIKKTAGGYAIAPTTLVSFVGGDSGAPVGTLVADANGDLFGTTEGSGADDNGTVFEIKNTTAGYVSAPIIVATFDLLNGSAPAAGLIADANGDLFGTTAFGGPFGDGTVFEITDSGFVAAPLPPPPVTSSILWQNTGGQAAIWDLSGTTLVGGGPVSPNPGPSWKTIGTDDFFGIGPSDILWQNADGQAAIWEMNGTTLIGGGTVSPNPGSAWQAIGTGDFFDRGLSDILWQNIDGQAAIWEMNGTKVIGGGTVSPNPGPSWKAIGTGDFNDDDHSDILWQDANGQIAIWEMNGTTLIGGGTVSANPGLAWKAIGTGHFYGAGDSDILLQNTSSGQVAIWEMNGTKIIGGGTVSVDPGPTWHAIGTDGGSDILLQSTSGQAAIWDMNGTSVIGGGAVNPNPGSSWRAVGLTRPS